jgi:hypothetical protein
MSSASEPWVREAAAAGALRDRPFLASAFAAEAERLETSAGAAARAAFLRGVLTALVERQRPLVSGLRLPDAVKRLVEREFTRIGKNLTKGTDEAFDLKHHTMRCDFRIAGFGRVPAGVEHIELGGVPRRLMWTGGVRQALQVGRAFARAGAAAPFYAAHLTHGIKPWAFLMAYNPETLTAWQRNVADCLRLNPSVRGLIASSWWYDPQIRSVAPHLAFLTEGSLAHGAVLARTGPTEGSTKYALANSPERQALYEAGRYRPMSYSVIWSRQALLRWADSLR